MPRYNLGFKILTSRFPFAKASISSDLIKLMGVIRTELQAAVSELNEAFDALFIQTASGGDLDKHGTVLNLARNGGEHDDDYRDRLLTEFRDIPSGLTIASLKNAVDQVMGGNCSIEEYYDDQWLWPEDSEAIFSILGNDSVGASYQVVAADELRACKFLLASDATVNLRKITVYLDIDGSGYRTAYCSIYNDNAGTPSGKVADADYTLKFDAPGWYEFEFKDVQLSQNNNYWLAISVTGGSWKYFYDAGTSNQLAAAADAPPPDDPFPTPAYSAREMSVYAEYHIYNWEKMLDNFADRFVVAAIVATEPTENELDQIETNVIQEKPAHIVVRIVEERPGFYELFREIA